MYKTMKRSAQEETSESNSSSKKGKKYERHFIKSWMNTFSPWIARDPNDHNSPYCKLCKSSLNCNTCHLKRHARTEKHKINVEIFLGCNDSAKNNDGNDAQSNKLNTSYENSNNSTNSTIKRDTSEHSELEDHLDDACKTGTINDETSNEDDDVSRVEKLLKNKDKRKLLRRIQKERTDLFSSYDVFSSKNERMEKDHVELFFESIVLSVKNLSPKLIAEAKLRVLQMVAELELREMTAKESSL